MASEAEQETKLCGNCKRDIPISNFTIHEIHCKRNLSVCDVCKEPVLTTDMEEHLATEHAPITCKCKMIMEKCALEEHELSACPLRLVKCQFCELELAFSKLEVHVDYCGARTERCEKCGRSVMIKDHKNHPDVCGKETDSKKPAIDDEAWFDIAKNDNILRDQIYSRMPVHLPSRFYGRSILTPSLQRFDTGAERNKDIEQVALRTNPVERGKIRPNVRDVEPYGGRREVQPHTSSFQSRSNPIGFISDPSANLGSGSEYDFKERVTRTWHRQKNASLMNNEPFKVDPPVAQTDKDVQLPCEFCENLFPEEDLILHQSGCNSLASVSCSDPKHTPTAFLKDEKKQVHDWTYQPSEHIRSESPTEFIQKSSSIFIPCEFCGEQMEEDVLLSHQFRCNPHAYASFCDRTTSSSVLEYEKTSVCDWTKEPSDQTIHPNSPPTTLCRSDNILIPCEFCGVQMEENVLFHHQDQCDFCPDPIHPSSDDPFYQENSVTGYAKNLIKESTERPQQSATTGPSQRDPFQQPRTSYLTGCYSLDENRKSNIKENSVQRDELYNNNLFHRDLRHLQYTASPGNGNTRNNSSKEKKLNTVSREADKEE